MVNWGSGDLVNWELGIRNWELGIRNLFLNLSGTGLSFGFCYLAFY
jgi:hypothetical protein